jgi:hypothetical protein
MFSDDLTWPWRAQYDGSQSVVNSHEPEALRVVSAAVWLFVLNFVVTRRAIHREGARIKAVPKA